MFKHFLRFMTSGFIVVGAILFSAILWIILLILWIISGDPDEIDIHTYYVNNLLDIKNISEKIIESNICNKEQKDSYRRSALEAVEMPNIEDRKFQYLCNSDTVAFVMNDRTIGFDWQTDYLVFSRKKSRDDLYDSLNNYIVASKPEAYTNIITTLGEDMYMFQEIAL